MRRPFCVQGGDGVKLTVKQKRFVDEYLVDFNGTQAAIRAGYATRSAEVTAAKLLRNAKVQAEISRRQQDLQRRTEVSQDRVVKELMRVAFADATNYVQVQPRTIVGADGKEIVIQAVVLTATAELTDEERAAISQIKQGANGIEVKMYDKLRALELLGRHIGMFNDKLELKATVAENPFAGLSTDELRRLIDSG